MVAQGTAAAFAAEGLSKLSQGTAQTNEEAIALFERALGVDGAFAVAHMGLAKAYVQRTDELGLGRDWLGPAVTAGKRALDLDPSLGDAYVALGLAYRISGWLREEFGLWQRRAQLADRDPNAKEKLGWLLWFTGRGEEALPWLSAALALRPRGRWTHFFLGNANLSLGRFDEAERMYATALELHPDHSSAQAGVIWAMLAAHKDEAAQANLRRFQAGTFDDDRYPLKLADIEYFVGEDDNASLHARQALAEPEERYWPRGILPSTILGAVLWPADRADAEAHLANSEKIDRARLDGGDQGYMPHIDLAAVAAIRGQAAAACASLRSAIAAGWRYPSLAARDRLFENLRTNEDFRLLIAVRPPVSPTRLR